MAGTSREFEELLQIESIDATRPQSVITTPCLEFRVPEKLRQLFSRILNAKGLFSNISLRISILTKEMKSEILTDRRADKIF